jgi:hypothetical protein
MNSDPQFSIKRALDIYRNRLILSTGFSSAIPTEAPFAQANAAGRTEATDMTEPNVHKATVMADYAIGYAKPTLHTGLRP